MQESRVLCVHYENGGCVIEGVSLRGTRYARVFGHPVQMPAYLSRGVRDEGGANQRIPGQHGTEDNRNRVGWELVDPLCLKDEGERALQSCIQQRLPHSVPTAVYFWDFGFFQN